MSKKGGGGNDGFKTVKSTANKKSKTTSISSVVIGGTHYEVGMLLDTTGKQAAIAAAKRGEMTAAVLCPYFKNVGPNGNDCSKKMNCYNIHLVSQCAVLAKAQSKLGDTVCGVFYQHDKLHIGVSSTNVASSGLAGILKGLSDNELGSDPGHDTQSVDTPSRALTRDKRVVIAIDPTGTKLRDDAFSCELIHIAQKEDSSTKQVLAFTSYTPNFVDQGIEMGKLTPAVLDRASRLFLPHYIHTPVKLWGYWAETISFSTDYATSAIAATKYYDVTINKIKGGTHTVRVVGESADQPEEPICIEYVQLSHTIDYTASNDLIKRSMSDTTTTSITDSEYFKLPSSSSRMEYALVLAGAVAGWCLRPDDSEKLSIEEAAALVRGPANVSASLSAVCGKFGVKLSISYRGYSELSSEPFGHNIVSVAGDQIGKMCYKIVDPQQVSCTTKKFQPTEDQLRQLRAIAGTKVDAPYEDVATQFLKLEEYGYDAGDIERSIGCDTSEQHVPMSEYLAEDWIRCTKPLRSFICCYHQFVILNAIDKRKDGPAGIARNRLFSTLPSLPKLLVQWTTKRDSMSITDFKCTQAITTCIATLAPHIVVPVKGTVVQSPQEDGGFAPTLRVYIPSVTPPSCDKSPSGAVPDPVIITIPASCVRDKDGNATHAFDMSMCGVGRTVMLMVSLAVLSKLANGMVVSDGVTLVPEVPLSLLPKWFGNNPLATDDDYEQVELAQSICWEE